MFTKESWFPAVNQKGVIGRFTELEVIDVDGSHKAGYQITKIIPVLEERTLLSNDYVPVKLPKDPVLLKKFTDKYPEAWAIFTGGHPQLQGTPLSEKFHDLAMPKAVAQRYEFNGVLYWEQIADLSDAGCANLGFGSMKMRTDVLKAMGKPIPNAGPSVQLAAGMSAADAMAMVTQPGGSGQPQNIIELLTKMIAAQLGMVPQAVREGTVDRVEDVMPKVIPQPIAPTAQKPALERSSTGDPPQLPQGSVISASAAAEAAAEAAKQASRRR